MFSEREEGDGGLFLKSPQQLIKGLGSESHGYHGAHRNVQYTSEPYCSSKHTLHREVDSPIGVELQSTLFPLKTGVGGRLLASCVGEPSSIPGGIAPGFTQVGIVPGDAAARWVFSGFSSLPSHSFWRCFILTSFHPHRREGNSLYQPPFPSFYTSHLGSPSFVKALPPSSLSPPRHPSSRLASTTTLPRLEIVGVKNIAEEAGAPHLTSPPPPSPRAKQASWPWTTGHRPASLALARLARGTGPDSYSPLSEGAECQMPLSSNQDVHRLHLRIQTWEQPFILGTPATYTRKNVGFPFTIQILVTNSPTGGQANRKYSADQTQDPFTKLRSAILLNNTPTYKESPCQFSPPILFMLLEVGSRRRLTTAGHTHLHISLVRCPDDKRRRSQCYVGRYRAQMKDRGPKRTRLYAENLGRRSNGKRRDGEMERERERDRETRRNLAKRLSTATAAAAYYDLRGPGAARL
ncbi:hypothetical protein PR048_031538 [Dryococelus australis]|uniref:Uncharacterized protein n=1 Tax=Dryococelus australis TaxID=614101 RepID=A0ABQ9G5K5_9NEOP|nr:hypothetical protein PR048_031538 [Dryococelus australis]